MTTKEKLKKLAEAVESWNEADGVVKEKGWGAAWHGNCIDDVWEVRRGLMLALAQDALGCPDKVQGNPPPTVRQYRALHREIPPDAILLFRLGDFYEIIGADAIVASPILGTTLSRRWGYAITGFPYHALDSYLARLVSANKTVAIADMAETPKQGKIARREITRIIKH